jgi:CRISPR-associated protein Cmr6
MVFDRPQRPKPAQRSQPPQPPHPAAQNSAAKPAKKVITSGGQGGNGGNHGNGNQGGNGGNSPEQPSPWLGDTPTCDPAASFVEYLRWMRSPDEAYKDPTKVEILQLAQEKANYAERLKQMNARTRLIAGEKQCFQVKTTWRIRVGGHRGPESILLPAFDALGMPYIPSSTLRGAARDQAIRHFEAQGLKRQEAIQKVAPYFGGLDAEGGDRTGKVIFLDAYPLATEKAGGLAVDMANNIWNWDNQVLKYAPNPNPFLSLRESTFLIGLRRMPACENAVFQQIQQWLIAGLQAGIGSQVNTGYGELVTAGNSKPGNQPFFEVAFSLEGQLIHGRQKFTQWNWNANRNEWQMRGKAEAEVRPVAFKSMLRYWFRALALGVLPSSEVKRWESTLFGAINPQKRGWVTVRVAEGKVVRPEATDKKDPPGEQSGVLKLSFSSEISVKDQQSASELFKILTWLMFHLGGLGQGARRPCYSRKSRSYAPWWRGSTLIPETETEFWSLPDTAKEFQKIFQSRLQGFYTALGQLSERSLNPKTPLAVGQVTRDRWVEAVDQNCCIMVCAGKENFGKPYALAVLHSEALKVKNHQGVADYDPTLCGKVRNGVAPSPVWVVDCGDYQVVTVFGATQNPRKQFLSDLREDGAVNTVFQVFPFS